MTPATPSPSDPLRSVNEPRRLPSHNAAQQRRAMQAAIASAVRALRSQDGRRTRSQDSFGPPPAGQ
jgi:hypothetical protein